MARLSIEVLDGGIGAVEELPNDYQSPTVTRLGTLSELAAGGALPAGVDSGPMLAVGRHRLPSDSIRSRLPRLRFGGTGRRCR